MIPDDVVERVREEADIVSLIGEYVKLKRVGTSFRGPCPFHHGKDANFSVTTRGGYKCFVCGESGDVFTFVQKHLGLDFVEAVKLVGAKFGVEVRETAARNAERDSREPFWETMGAATSFFAEQLWDAEWGRGARDYLAKRGLDRDAVERFSLGFAPRDLTAMRSYLGGLGFDDARQLGAGLLAQREDRPDPVPRFRDRVMFPIYDVGGHVVGFGGRALGDFKPKYLNSAESAVFSKGQLLYGLNWAKQAVRKADRLVVVEGYFDAIRLILAGVEEVVAPLGTALTEAQAALIRRYTKNVFLLYDSDQAGLKATFRSGDALLATGGSVRVITLPEGEDPDTFVAKEGAEGFERAASAAVDVFERKVQILERNGWFADLRRKRQALDKLLPTIRVTTDALLRDLYVSLTSDAAGVSREMLERELAAESSTGRRPVAARRDSSPPDEPPPDAAGVEPSRVRRTDRRRDHLATGVRAERELVRMLLHQRMFIEATAERVGTDHFVDPVYGHIFKALIVHGPEASIEQLAHDLDPEAIEVLQELLADSGGLERSDEVVAGSIDAIMSRDLAARLGEIDRLLPLASDAEKDVLIREKTQLAHQMNDLKRPRWKSFGQIRS